MAGGRAPERSGERHQVAGADIAKKRERGSTFRLANVSPTKATSRAAGVVNVIGRRRITVGVEGGVDRGDERGVALTDSRVR